MKIIFGIFILFILLAILIKFFLSFYLEEKYREYDEISYNLKQERKRNKKLWYIN